MGVAGEEVFKFYMLFGGVPYYYRLAQQWGVKTVEEAVRLLVAGEGGPLRHEVEFVLAETLGGEYRTHLAILDAVTGGATKLEQIASHAGVKATSLRPRGLRPMRLSEAVSTSGRPTAARGLVAVAE
jgi:hypothetical protein